MLVLGSFPASAVDGVMFLKLVMAVMITGVDCFPVDPSEIVPSEI